MYLVHLTFLAKHFPLVILAGYSLITFLWSQGTLRKVSKPNSGVNHPHVHRLSFSKLSLFSLLVSSSKQESVLSHQAHMISFYLGTQEYTTYICRFMYICMQSER